MFFKLILILVLLQVVAAWAPVGRGEVMATLQSLGSYDQARKGTGGTWAKPPKVPKKDAAVKTSKSNNVAGKPPKLSKKEDAEKSFKVRLADKLKSSHFADMVKSSGEHIAAVMRKPHTTGAMRYRLAMKANSQKLKVVPECRNQFCCGECSGNHTLHTGPWYKCYGECAKKHPTDNKNYRHVAQAA